MAVKCFLGDGNLYQEEIYVGKISSNESKTSIEDFFDAFINFKQIFSKTQVPEIFVFISEITIHRGIDSKMMKINFAFSDLEFLGSLIGA